MNPTDAMNFVVLCAPRSGSNLLIRSLNCSPEVVAIGEVAQHDPARFDPWSVDQAALLAGIDRTSASDLAGRDPLKLCRLLFAGGRGRSIGFKLFYHHQLEHPGFWMGLSSLRPMVIHLIRSNLLDVFVSLRYAMRNDVWFEDRIGSPASDHEDITVWPPDLAEFFFLTTQLRRRALDFLRPCTILELSYSELAENPRRAVNGVLESLGRPMLPSNFVVPLQKQARRSTRDKITNYAELSAHFRDTEWAKYFD